jgi:hypothetical protein
MDPATPAEAALTGFVCIMDPNNLAGPQKYRVSVQHTDTTAPILSNTGRAVIQ